MKIRVSITCLCLLSAAAPCAWADANSKATKIAELAQLTGARQLLHEVDSKSDQEEAVRAWERFYLENVTETDLDSILAYYRSPAGQKDVSASRAALEQVQRYMHEKHAPTTSARVGSAPPVPVTESTRQTTSGATSPPRAPDGRVVPSPSSPEQCEVTSTASSGTHASGRSVVCVCTDEKGTLIRDPVIAESSGDPRVDSGAIKMARIDSGRYVPPAVNGQPQSACFRFAIDFSHHE
jgi:hypothetical protein